MSRTQNFRVWPDCRALLLALAAAATAFGLRAEDRDLGHAATGPPPAVTVISVQPTAVTPGAGFNGRVVAVDDVQLRARVTGFLEKRLFEEGADVEAGELLFVIEKAPYQAVVDSVGPSSRVPRRTGQHCGPAAARRRAGQEQEYPTGGGRRASRRR